MNGFRSLDIVEIGPGRASLVDSILDFLKNYNLELYRNINYELVEISPILAETCRKQLTEKHPTLMKTGQIKITNQSVFDYKRKSDRDCFVLAMEILDNMPHDRLWKMDPRAPSWTHQTMINEQMEEERVPIEDAWCQKYVSLEKSMPGHDHISSTRALKREGIVQRFSDLFFPKSEDARDNIFIPTTTLMLFEKLKR